MAVQDRVKRAQQLQADYRQWQRDVEGLQEEWLDALQNAAKHFHGDSRPGGNSRPARPSNFD